MGRSLIAIAILALVAIIAIAVAVVATKAWDWFGEATEAFWTRISRWLIWTVLVALVPLGADYINGISDAGGKFPPLTMTYEHGELCIITTALAGAALGELLGLTDRSKLAKVVLGGLCGLAIFVGAILYVTKKALSYLPLPWLKLIDGFQATRP